MNWTAVLVGLVTGGTAMVVGWLAYIGAKLAANVELRKSEATSEERREERAREELGRRRELYHRFLNEERSIFPALASQEAGGKPVEEWINSLYDSVNGIVLTTPEHVAVAAKSLHAILLLMSEHEERWAEDEGDQATFDEDVKKWNAARRKLIDEMRRDVAPDKAPLWPASSYTPPSEAQKSEPAE